MFGPGVLHDRRGRLAITLDVDRSPKPVDVSRMRQLLDRFHELAARWDAARPAASKNEPAPSAPPSVRARRRRAILWLCWGPSFIAEAIESARSAASIEADRILLTEAEGVRQAEASGVFHTVAATRLLHLNFLEKSRLIDLLPEGYDSYLYLDTDTRIIGDIELGFEMAERHGVAVAPAPNYNLSAFFNFGALMPHAGLRSADQMQFNAGVIFFSAAPTVRRVLTLWRDLCLELSAEHGFLHDQPVLTMAFEQSGFLPYVLSPLYNYRGLGELAVGSIRIWHSHHPPPADLNNFETAWPPRRFVDGALARSDSATAPPLSAEPSRSMLRQKLLTAPERLGAPRALSIARTALAIKEEQGSREAVEYALRHFGMETADDLNEWYYAEALSYHLGLLFAHDREPERMAEQISLSKTMPGHDDDLLFSDHVQSSRLLDERRRRAKARAMPPLLFACMPRSASATLAGAVAEMLDMPVFHLALGRFPNLYLAPSWLDMFLEGGGITQDHLDANDFNVGVLSARAPRDVFVLARDPRAAARSYVHHLSRGRVASPRALEAAIEQECVARFIPWLQGWIDCSEGARAEIRVHWTTFGEVRDEPAAAFRKIVHAMQAAYLALSPYAHCEAVPDIRRHFVSGDDDGWRAEVGDAAKARMWDALTPEMRDLLALKR